MLALELKVYRSGQIVIAEIDVNNPPEKEDHRPIVAMVARSAFIISWHSRSAWKREEVLMIERHAARTGRSSVFHSCLLLSR